MKIFTISGLGADQRVFDYLTLDHELVPVTWIVPNSGESIVDYAKRLIEKYRIGSEANFGVLGVSFGGLIAIEISKLTNPKQIILISSVETRDELSGLIKLIGRLDLIEITPKQMFNLPKVFACFIFGAENKRLLNQILDDTDLSFTKWAIRELLNWNNQTRFSSVIKIGGTKDKLLPPKGDNVFLIEGAQHFMIVDKAIEISKVINEELAKPMPHTPNK